MLHPKLNPAFKPHEEYVTFTPELLLKRVADNYAIQERSARIFEGRHLASGCQVVLDQTDFKGTATQAAVLPTAVALECVVNQHWNEPTNNWRPARGLGRSLDLVEEKPDASAPGSSEERDLAMATIAHFAHHVGPKGLDLIEERVATFWGAFPPAGASTNRPPESARLSTQAMTAVQATELGQALDPNVINGLSNRRDEVRALLDEGLQEGRQRQSEQAAPAPAVEAATTPRPPLTPTLAALAADVQNGKPITLNKESFRGSTRSG